MEPRIRVQTEAFDPGLEIARLSEASKQVGAIASFVGVIRDINDDATVSTLYLEHYSGMTEHQIGDIINEANTRWQMISATVIHRVGLLHPAEQIVFVGVASSHRGEAFDACEFIMDYLKTRAAFWKREQTSAGPRWLETRDSDIKAANAHENKPQD